MPDRADAAEHAFAPASASDWNDDGLGESCVRPPGVDLCSNDYLGLAQHPHLKRAHGGRGDGGTACGSTGSRLAARGAKLFRARGTERFARFKGTERSLYFSSGYLANLAVLRLSRSRGCDLLG